MSSIWTRDLCEQIIACYKDHPSLWDTNDETYHDKKNWISSYKEIHEGMLEFQPTLTIECIKNKISSLRSQYSRELRQLKASSRRLGARSNKQIRPRLWCFEQLDFLRSHMRSSQILNSQKSSEDMSEYIEESSDDLKLLNHYHNRTIIKLERKNNLKRNGKWINVSHQSHKNKRPLLTDEDDVNGNEHDNDNNLDDNTDIDNDNEDDNDNLLIDYNNDNPEAIINCPIENADQIVTNDNAELYGKCWAAEYRKLNTTQQMYAKRAIDEVLFQGRVGNLTIESTEIKIVGT